MSFRGGSRGRGASLLIGGIIGILVFVFWLAGTDPSSGVVRPEVAAPGVAKDEEPDLLAVESTAEADPARLEVDAPVESAAAPPVAAEGPPLEEPLTSGIAVRVLRGRTDEPVPHAVVTCGRFRRYTDASSMEIQARGASVMDQMEDVRHYRANEDGLVLLPLHQTYTFALAEDGGDWGHIEFEPVMRYEPIELRLMPDADVVVRVLRALDRSPVADAEVALLYELGSENIDTLETATTDAEGIARFEHIRQYTAYYWAHSERVLVGLAGRFDVADAIAFDPVDVPEMIELVMPALSALDVTVLDADGRIYEEPFLVALSPGHDDDGAGIHTARVAYDGRVSFEQIELAHDLTLGGRSRHGVPAAPVKTRSAPNAGGRIPVTLTLGPSPPMLVGRLLDATGAPIVEEDVNIAVGAHLDRSRSSRRVRTGADGRFRLTHGWLATKNALDLRITRRDGPADQAVRREFPGPVEGVHDLGDLRMVEVPPLVSGTVVDEDGAVVPGARVYVHGTDMRGQPKSMLTAPLAEDDGTFVAYGETPDNEVDVRPSHPLFGDVEQTQVLTGTTGLELVLPNGGGIAGGVILDEEWLCDFTVAEVWPSERAVEDESNDTAWIERPGRFTFEGLKPGTYTVRVAMEGESENGVVVEGVKVEAGKLTRDPRLNDVDLRGLAGVKEFRIVDGNGEPVPDGRIAHRARGSLDWSADGWFENGVAHVFTVLDELDLYVTADGHRAAFVPNAREDAEIVLPEGIAVRFYWEKPRPRASGRMLTLGISGNEDGMPAVHTGLTVNHEPDAITRVPIGAQFDLVWRCYGPDANGRTRLLETHTEKIEIKDTGGTQDIGLTPPPEVLAFFSDAGDE